MPKCCVDNCTFRTNKGAQFYSFPSDPERHQLWLQIVAKPNLHQNALICDRHFSESQIETRHHGKWGKLKPNAFPDLVHSSVRVSTEVLAKKHQDDDVFIVPDDPEFIDCDAPSRIEPEFIDCSSQEAPSPAKTTDDVQPEFVDCSDSTADDSNSYENRLKNYVDQIAELRKQLKFAQTMCSTYSQQLTEQRAKVNSDLKLVFNDDQITYIKNNKKTIWTEKTLVNAYRLYRECGKDGYNEMLRQNLPYPSIETLEKRLIILKNNKSQHELVESIVID